MSKFNLYSIIQQYLYIKNFQIQHRNVLIEKRCLEEGSEELETEMKGDFKGEYPLPSGIDFIFRNRLLHYIKNGLGIDVISLLVEGNNIRIYGNDIGINLDISIIDVVREGEFNDKLCEYLDVCCNITGTQLQLKTDTSLPEDNILEVIYKNLIVFQE